MLQDHSIIGEVDVLGGGFGLRSLLAQEIQHASGQYSEIIVLSDRCDSPSSLFSEFSSMMLDDAVHNGPFILNATLSIAW